MTSIQTYQWFWGSSTLAIESQPRQKSYSRHKQYRALHKVKEAGRLTGTAFYLLLWSFSRRKCRETPADESAAAWTLAHRLRSIFLIALWIIRTKIWFLFATVVVVHRYRPFDGILLVICEQTLASFIWIISWPYRLALLCRNQHLIFLIVIYSANYVTSCRR